MADLPVDSEGPQSVGEEAMDTSGSSTSTMDTPLPVPDQPDDEANMQEDGGVDSDGEDEENVDLDKMAKDYAHYLVVNSKQDTQQLDERIESVVFRVEEFKQQLSRMHTNITSTSDKMRQLHGNTEELKALYTKIDQVEAFVNVVGGSVDQLEEAVSKAEKELDPSKLRKMFTAFRRSSKPEATPTWQPPKVFRTREYFTIASASLSTSPPPLQGQRSNTGELETELEKKTVVT